MDMAILEQQVEKKQFHDDLKVHGLPSAQQQAKKRTVYRTAFKHRPPVCRGCSTTMFCRVCSHGDWLHA